MKEKDTLTFYAWLFGTSFAYFISTTLHLPGIGSFSIRGFAWSVMFLVSVFYLFKGKPVTMPYWIWLPWLAMVVIYWMKDLTFFGLQGSLQMICFPLVGFAASTLIYTERIFLTLLKWLKYYLIYAIVFGAMRMISTPDAVMTYTLFSCFVLAVAFTFNYKKGYIIYGVMLLIVASFVTRMGILMMLVAAAFNFANRNIVRKCIFGGLIAIAGIAIFYSNGFQQKTFGTEGGTLEQLDFSEMGMGKGIKGINNNGREYLWDHLNEGIAEKPVWGHGTRADRVIMSIIGFGETGEVHNDYLAVTYNYGYVGLSLLLFAFIMQFLLLLRQRKKIKYKETLVIYSAAATAFLCWIGFMYSDNILKYSIQYGNFHFCMIAIVYSRIRYRQITDVMESQGLKAYPAV